MTFYPDQEIISSPRLLWHCLAFDNCDLARTYGPMREHLVPVDEVHPANLVSSECEDGLHRLLLDLDLPFEHSRTALANHVTRALRHVAHFMTRVEIPELEPSDILLVPSTHNWHAYVPKVALRWEVMYLVLDYLAEEHIGVTHDWAMACDVDEMAALRPPSVRKPEPGTIITHPGPAGGFGAGLTEGDLF